MAKMLTARTVETAQPRRNAAGQLVRREYPDAGCPGLYLIVQPSGAKSWALRYRRADGRTAKHTLVGDLTLAGARHAAAAARLEVERGSDPAPLGHRSASADSVAVQAATFVMLHVRRKTRATSARSTESIFNNHVLPAWGTRSVHDIKRRDVIELVEKIAADHPPLSIRLCAVLSKFFGWLCARDVLATSPVVGVERPHQEEARQRVLTDQELCALWNASAGDELFGPALRLLVLTGQRRTEVSHMRWSEIDEEHRLWRLPPPRVKSNRPHIVPMPTQAWQILAAMPVIDSSDYVFTSNGRRPIHGWDKAKKRLSKRSGLDERGWRLHDLRRSAASGMQRLGVPVPVIEKCLNHAGGVFRGIVTVYQQYDYQDEMRIALQKWGNHVERIVGGESGKVVKLRQR
jgi:integrase